MAVIVAELNKLLHSVVRRSKNDALEGPWSDRWSIGFYISEASFTRHRDLATAAATSPPTSSDAAKSAPPRLARSLETFGLPERAARLRALQEGGWLANRYDAGPPWAHIAAALGEPLLPVTHAQPEGLYQLLPPLRHAMPAETPQRTYFSTRSSSHVNTRNRDARR